MGKRVVLQLFRPTGRLYYSIAFAEITEITLQKYQIRVIKLI